MLEPKNKGGRPRKTPLPQAKADAPPVENIAPAAETPEAPPVFTPMDTDKPPIPPSSQAYAGKVMAIVSGDVAQLFLDSGVQLMDAKVFKQVFTPVKDKEAAPAPEPKGKWSFTFHTPKLIPQEFQRPNGTFDTAKMSEWLDADPKNAKAGIPGCMIGGGA